MKKVMFVMFILAAIFLISCALSINPVHDNSQSNDTVSSGSRISFVLQGTDGPLHVKARDIGVSENKITNVTILMTDSNGGSWTTNWSPGQAGSFSVGGKKSGTYTITVFEKDDSGKSYNYSKTFTFKNGYNYTITITIGGNVYFDIAIDLPSITLDGNLVKRTVNPGLILGGNLGAWVGLGKYTADVKNSIINLGRGIMRFPGGNLSDGYCWITIASSNSTTGNYDDWSWGTSLVQFVPLCKSINSVPLYSLNPFDHYVKGQFHTFTNEALQLAAYLSSNGFSSAYYEVGNENDGFWNPMLSVDDYTDRFIAIATLLKEFDPTIHMIGPVGGLDYLEGFVNRMKSLGKLHLVDYVSYHFYGTYIANDNNNNIDLNNPQLLRSQAARIRSLVGTNNIKIAVTEYNAAIWNNTERGKFTIQQGLWLADFIGMLFNNMDMGNTWIDVFSPGADHTLIQESDGKRTMNYWPCYLAKQALVGTTTNVPASLSVLEINTTLSTSNMTVYGTRNGNSAGLFLVNKTTSPIAFNLSVTNFNPTTVLKAWFISDTEYKLNNGPSSLAVITNGKIYTVSVPGLSCAGIRME